MSRDTYELVMYDTDVKTLLKILRRERANPSYMDQEYIDNVQFLLEETEKLYQETQK